MFKTETKVVHKAEYHDVEEFIKEEMGFNEYEIPVIEEAGNDQVLEMAITSDAPGEYDIREIRKMLDSGEPENYSLRNILNYLCSIGKIPPGTYLIDVSW